MGFFKKKVDQSIEQEMSRLTSGAVERASTGTDPMTRTLGSSGEQQVRQAMAAFEKFGIHLDADDALGTTPAENPTGTTPTQAATGGRSHNPFGHMKDPVHGSMHVVGATALDPREMRAPCHVTYVIQAEGVAPFSGEHTFELWSSQWPSPGDDLPVVFDRENPGKIEIRTDEVMTHAESARQHADALAAQLQAGGQIPAAPAADDASPPAGGLPAGFQFAPGATPIVIGDADPQRIQEALARASQVLGVDLTGAMNAATAAPQPAPGDIVDRLERLAKLRESGAITDAEFATQKQRLLNE